MKPPPETTTLSALEEQCLAFLDHCADFNFLVRSIDLQRAKFAEIDALVERVRGYKLGAIKMEYEFAANRLFHLQCMLRSMQASLSVWIKLKEGEHLEAWRLLVDAQEYKDVALLTHDYEGIRNLEAQLNKMREVLFPHFNLYNSPGWVETVGKCSICGSPFSICEHIENRVYMGRLCRRVDREVLEILHSALVRSPRDRRCVITKRSEGNRMIDNFTLEDVGPRKHEGEEMLIESVLWTPNRLDLN